MDFKKRLPLVLLILGLLAFVFYSAIGSPPSAPAAVSEGSLDSPTPTPDSYLPWRGIAAERKPNPSFSDLAKMIRAGEIVSLVVSGQSVTAETVGEETFAINFGDGDLLERLVALGVTPAQLAAVEIRYVNPPPVWLSMLLFYGLVSLVLFVVISQVLRRSSGSGGSSGPLGGYTKSGAKVVPPDQPHVTFEDVAGLPEAKEELIEVVDFLKDPEKFLTMGARIPKGVILFGYPGCGKTLLARAVAGEAGVPFFSIAGSQFVEVFVGVGASRVRDLFNQAKKNAPCIVFVDEIDAVGSRRMAGGTQETNQTLNELLSQMDGFDQNTSIVVMAATNRLDVLDPALLRSGRFDRRVAVDRPDVRAREMIFEVHVRGKPLAEGVDLKVLAAATPGFTGADIENTVNEAAILAVRRGRKDISMREFQDAAEKSFAGPERKSRVMSIKERRIIAYHEVGHALAMHYTKGADPVYKISIISRGLALGYTMPLPEDRNLLSRDYILGQMVGLLGGRAAEELIFGGNEITTGASNDLQRASDYARRMVTEWGMSGKVGLRSFVPLPGSSEFDFQFRGEKSYSEYVAQKIDEEIQQLLEEAYAKAKEILEIHREDLQRVVERILEIETLESEEFLRLLSPQTQA